MGGQLYFWVVMAFGLLAPFAFDRYLRSLPVAPSCPACRAVTRAIRQRNPLWRLLPVQLAITLSECARCGWRGRMRWRWAKRTVLHDRG